MIQHSNPAFVSSTSVRRSGAEIQLAIRLEKRLQSLMQFTLRAHVCEDLLQLFGTVATWHQKQLAQEIARDLAPEYRIRNELRVTAG
jgi:hypothetical protein